MSASFEEKSAWVQLGALLLVLGGYFAAASEMLSAGVMEMTPYAATFAVATVLLVIVLIVGHVVAVCLGGSDDADERDRVIGWRAEANSGWVLGAGVFLALNAMAFGVATVWVAHLLLACLFLSEVLKLALQLRYYRRGM